jgi:beta-lactamase class A
MNLNELKEIIEFQLKEIRGNYAVAFKNLSNPYDVILINEKELFHAASTMKTCVMLEVFRQAEEGRFTLADEIKVRNEFISIADGSMFKLDIDRDGDELLYNLIGRRVTIYNLIYNMITVSSNLATNLLIELVTAENVMRYMQKMGAKCIRIIRGVEDMKAYELGMNNTLTALDLLLVFERIASHKAVSKRASEEMIKILSEQKFNEIIPALLPKDIKVAHKTGSFENLRHDSGIIFLPDGKKYILILLSSNLENNSDTVKIMANISKDIYDYMTEEK